MAFEIADYDDLQARISRRAGGSSDTEFADGVREAIHLAESEMNSKLRVSEMMVRSIETVDERWESLPTGFLALRAAWYVNSDGKDIEIEERRASPDRIAYLSRFRGCPKAICIVGGQYRVEPRLDDESFQVRLLFYRRVPDLSDDTPCTIILNRYPTLYLNGALSNLEAWLTGDPRLQVWRGMFEGGIAAANAAHRTRIGGGA